MRFNFHGGFDYDINKDVSITPQFLYMYQRKATELNLGVMAFYKLEESDYKPMIGLSWRNKDAIVFHIGLKQKNYFVRLSYDSSISYLKNYAKNGFEFSFIFTGRKKVPKAARISTESKTSTTTEKN
jgi:hypothetical protein